MSVSIESAFNPLLTKHLQKMNLSFGPVWLLNCIEY